MKVKNLIDQTFGRLTVLSQDGYIGASAAWLCLCECGARKTISAKHLASGSIKSCGCLGRENKPPITWRHGLARDPVYKIWAAMRRRCENPNDIYFKNYGARGIAVCERWHDFVNFIEDMGPRPLDGTIDRIDNDNGYEPGNCRWATRSEQMRNTRRTILIKFAGETLCAKDWAKRLGLSSGQVITWRLKKGWTIEQALTTPKPPLNP